MWDYIYTDLAFPPIKFGREIRVIRKLYSRKRIRRKCTPMGSFEFLLAISKFTVWHILHVDER